MVVMRRASPIGILLIILLALSLALQAGRVHAQDPKIVYIYDDLGRLVKVVNAETGEVAVYEYDAVGNILSIKRSAGGIQPPSITNISTSFFNQGETVCLRIEGTDLLGATISTDNPAIRITNVRTTETILEACIEIPFDVALGPATLTVSTAVGSNSITITVKGPLPAIRSVSPSQGTSKGGTAITITGANFTSDTTIMIGGNPATSVVFINDGKMAATTPPGPAGLRADVVVSHSSGSTTLPGGFTYSFPFRIPGAIALAIGDIGSLTVTVREPEATATTLNLVSANPAVATLPGSATIPAGELSAGVPVTAVSEGTTQVTVTLGGTSLSTVVFVSQPFSGNLDLTAPVVGSFVAPTAELALAPVVGVEVPPVLLATVVLSQGATRTITLTLAAPAPPGGLCVTITISHPAVGTVPAEVCIAEGEQTVTFTVTALASGQAIITVTAGGEVIELALLVDQTSAISGAALAAPVATFVTPTDGITLAPIVGVEVK
jgi:YD repeat-containing protein